MDKRFMYSFGVIPLCQFSERARAGDTCSAKHQILVCFDVSDENNNTLLTYALSWYYLWKWSFVCNNIANLRISDYVKGSYRPVSFVHVVRCHSTKCKHGWTLEYFKRALCQERPFPLNSDQNPPYFQTVDVKVSGPFIFLSALKVT